LSPASDQTYTLSLHDALPIYGLNEIPIEERNPLEVHEVGVGERRVRVTPEHSPAANYGFDVTPARLVTALITERGVCGASAEGRSEEHTSELQSREKLVCRLL